MELESAGLAVHVSVLRHGIATSAQAYEVESAAIDLNNGMWPGLLSNVVLGHHHAQRGLMSAVEAEILCLAQPAPQLPVPVALVSLNRLWRPDISDDESARV